MPIRTLHLWQDYFRRHPFGQDVAAFYMQQLTFIVAKALGGKLTMNDLRLKFDEDDQEFEEWQSPPHVIEFLNSLKEQSSVGNSQPECPAPGKD